MGNIANGAITGAQIFLISIQVSEPLQDTETVVVKRNDTPIGTATPVSVVGHPAGTRFEINDSSSVLGDNTYTAEVHRGSIVIPSGPYSIIVTRDFSFVRMLGGTSDREWAAVPYAGTAVGGVQATDTLDGEPLFNNGVVDNGVGGSNGNFDAYYRPLLTAQETYVSSPSDESIVYERFSGPNATGTLLSTEAGYWTPLTIGRLGEEFVGGVATGEEPFSARFQGSQFSLFFKGSPKQVSTYNDGRTTFLCPAGGSYRITVHRTPRMSAPWVGP